MYILLILVHSLFMFIAHMFGYYVIEGVFLVLMLFFLLYFSPIFFFKKEENDWKGLFSLNLSPQKSLIVPLVLTYLGIYILAFTFSWTLAQSIHVHMLIFLAIFSIFLGYTFSFEWKNDVFFDILSFHLLFSYMTLLIVGGYYFVFPDSIGVIDVIFVLVTLGFSVFFFSHEKKRRIEFFYCFLTSIFLGAEIGLLFMFPALDSYMLIGALALLALLLFEQSEKGKFFRSFFRESRIFFLGCSLLSALLLSGYIFVSFESIYFLMILTIFFFSVHIRFSNVVTYVAGILLMYLLYTFLFFGLIREGAIFSTLVFIYFFPLVIIVNTYFWEEKQKYDFAIIHYTSILFSIVFVLYALIFLSWWEGSLIFTSFGIFLLALLFFLSYFRFRNPSVS